MEVYEIYDKFESDIENGVISDVCIEEIRRYLLGVMRSDVSDARMLLSRLYRYLLKYRYQQENQAILWIEMIRMASIDLAIILEEKRIRDKLTVDIQQELYLHVAKGLLVEMNMTENIFIKNIPDEFRLENIMDYSAIHEYLRKYAYCKHIKDELNI